MDRISIETKSNFFETRVTEYSKANIGVNQEDIFNFSKDADF
jgi:ribonucleotide reductase beta subunit family protein with ferritin-like domain